MNKQNFRVIKGGKAAGGAGTLVGGKAAGGASSGLGMAAKGKALRQIPQPPKMTFVSAEATATRLMGVVGVVAHYLSPTGQRLTQVLHLDYEEYGIDGYQLFVDEAEEHIEREISKVTGGLGGVFVALSYEQYRHLVYEAFQVDPSSMHITYDLMPDFPELLRPLSGSEDSYDQLLDLVGPKAQTDYELMNYGLMRLTGLDQRSFAYLSDVTVPTAWHQEVTSPGTLLKNTITELASEAVVGVKGLKTYRCEALIDHIDRYKLMHIRFQIADTTRGRKIVGIHLESVMNISAYEASFQLRKREHLAVYEVVEDGFHELFEDNYPEMMVTGHGAGDLFTQFNTDNAHVDKAIYYLSGDVYANYYITDEDQLVVSSFSLETLDQVDLMLSHDFEGMLVKMGEMTADQSILFEFVTSGYGDIYAYLDDTKP